MGEIQEKKTKEETYSSEKMKKENEKKKKHSKINEKKRNEQKMTKNEKNKKQEKNKKREEKVGKRRKEGPKGYHPRWAPKLIFHIRTLKRNRNEIEAQKKNQILNTQENERK